MALSHVKPSSSTSEPAAVDDAAVLLSSETVAALAEPNATEAPGRAIQSVKTALSALFILLFFIV